MPVGAPRQVLITDIMWPSPDTERKLLAGAGAELELAQTGEEDELVELAAGAEAILTCFASVSAPVIRAARDLQVISRYGIGVDNIDVPTATELDVLVTNVPGYCTDEVVEHVLGMIFCLVRGFHRYDRAIRQDDWALAAGLPTRRIRGRTLGIVGFGAIGRLLAERATGLGMSVLVHRHHDQGEIAAAGARAVDLLTLSREADFVSLHLPLTPASTGLIDAAFLAAMKPTAYLINAARGGIVDQDALLHALRTGAIEGAGIDVFTPERLPADHPLLNQERLLATPHTAFYSEESLLELVTRAAQNVASVLSGHRPESVVNAAVLARPRWSHLR